MLVGGKPAHLKSSHIGVDLHNLIKPLLKCVHVASALDCHISQPFVCVVVQQLGLLSFLLEHEVW